MEKSNQKRGTTFTAEQVRHYLGLDNDYDDDCSTSSSDNNSQEDFTLDSTSSSLTDIDLNESDNETIIPPSPKRIKTLKSKRTNGKIVTNTSIQAYVSSTCKKQEHGKGACTAQIATSGNHPSLVALHTGQDSYTPVAETDTQLNSTSDHDKQNVSYQFQPGTEAVNTVTDRCIQFWRSGKREEHHTSTVQNNQTDSSISDNPLLETLENSQTTYTPTSETPDQYKGNDFDQSTLPEFEGVPEPVFTIQLDIPPINEDTLVSTNTVQIHVPTQEHVQNQHTVPVSIHGHQPQSTVTEICPETQSSPPHEIEFPPDYHPHNELSDIEDQNEYYEVETEPTPPDIIDRCTPITNYARDQINEFDVANGWEKIEPDVIPDHGPLTGIQGINMGGGNSREPEDFFNDLFEERMFTIMADETNNYARRKITEIMAGRDHVQQMDHYSHHQHARLGQWKDLNPSDMKFFFYSTSSNYELSS